jgi:heptosyltransferase III
VTKQIRTYYAQGKLADRLRLLNRFVDAYVWLRPKKRPTNALDPVRPVILFLTAGHLGDALILSYLFPMVRQQYPDAVIDVVAGAWCAPVWAGNPYIRRVVLLNHSNTNRSALSRRAKWLVFAKTTRSAIIALRASEYDFSIDIRFTSAQMHFLLPFIRVRHSIGFGTRGWGGLLDSEFFLPEGPFHIATVLGRLLTPLGIEADSRNIEPYFTGADASIEQVWQQIGTPQPAAPVVLLCPEAGSDERTLPAQFWQQIAERLLNETDSTLVFCGQQAFTTAIHETIGQEHPAHARRLVSAVGRLTIQAMAVLARSARFALTLDSFPAHLNVIFCPTVAFFNNGMGLQFFPINARPTFILHNNADSRSLTLDRAGFQSQYVETFDAAAIQIAFNWLADNQLTARS